MGKRDYRKREDKKQKKDKKQQEVLLPGTESYSPEAEVIRKPRKVREETWRE